MKKKTKLKKQLPDNIDEYFTKIEGTKEAYYSRELFKGEKDVDLKTDLTWEEITYINTLIYNDQLLNEAGIKPVFKPFIEPYMRLKFSLDRKSRGEFVHINKPHDDTESAVNLASGISNIMNPKK